MVQNNVNMKWALTVVASIFIVSIFFLCLCGSWPEILEEAKTTNVEMILSIGKYADKIKSVQGNHSTNNFVSR